MLDNISELLNHGVRLVNLLANFVYSHSCVYCASIYDIPLPCLEKNKGMCIQLRRSIVTNVQPGYPPLP